MEVPHSLEAEKAVIGSVLASPEMFPRLADLVATNDFYSGHHQSIYQAITSLDKMKEPITILSVGEYLADANKIEAIGGRGYLMELMMSVESVHTAPFHAKSVRKKALTRQLIHATREASELCYSNPEGMDLEAIIGGLDKKIKGILETGTQRRDLSFNELAELAFERIEARLKNPEQAIGISSGYDELDQTLGGLQDGNLIFIAGRPGMGKSALALNVAANVAFQKHPSVFFSLEMKPVALAERALRFLSGTKDDLKALRGAVDKTKDCDLEILNTPSLSLDSFRSELFKQKYKYGKLGLVVIDYLQLMKSESRLNTHERLGEITRGLKQTANEFEVPIICLSQLSRGVESREDKKPNLSDLRGSGSIEEDADAVLMVYRDDYYNKNSTQPGVAEIIRAKNREGATGSFFLNFNPEIGKFSNQTMYSWSR